MEMAKSNLDLSVMRKQLGRQQEQRPIERIPKHLACRNRTLRECQSALQRLQQLVSVVQKQRQTQALNLVQESTPYSVLLTLLAQACHQTFTRLKRLDSRQISLLRPLFLKVLPSSPNLETQSSLLVKMAKVSGSTSLLLSLELTHQETCRQSKALLKTTVQANHLGRVMQLLQQNSKLREISFRCWRKSTKKPCKRAMLPRSNVKKLCLNAMLFERRKQIW